MLDLYEATGTESYLLFAIDLQAKQDELFFDEAQGGYFASAPDEHIIVRMKDSQVGAAANLASTELTTCRMVPNRQQRPSLSTITRGYRCLHLQTLPNTSNELR